nr:hypothetical protein BaRGS_018926 [Batillaria attramentaria]
MLKTEAGLRDKFQYYGLQDKDIEFIKALIKGEKSDEDDGGRQAEKPFLYEIVANKRNGVDVDKWDYFLRDCHHLGMHTDFDHERMTNSARVIKAGEKGKEEQQICWRDKDKFNARELFHARYALHKRVYQHRVVKTVELMIVDAMAKVNNILTVTGENGKKWPLTKSIRDMEAYSKLTDSIFYQILNFDETQLKNEDEKKQLREAQELLKNVERRKLYRCIEAGGPTKEELPDKEQIKDQIIQKMQKMRQEALKDRIRVMIAKFDMGKAEKNQMYFYPKKPPNTATPGDLQQVKEQFVRVYLVPSGDKKADEESYNDIKEAFKKWCVENKIGTDRATFHPKKTVLADSDLFPELLVVLADLAYHVTRPTVDSGPANKF